MDRIDFAIQSENRGAFSPHEEMNQQERRIEKRHRVRDAADIAFYNNGRLYHGNIVNLTNEGACLLVTLDHAENSPLLAKGRTMECYATTNHGSSKCRGTVQWTRCTQNQLMWGISFIEISLDDDDPLQLLIRKTCSSRETIPVTGMAIY